MKRPLLGTLRGLLSSSEYNKRSMFSQHGRSEWHFSPLNEESYCNIQVLALDQSYRCTRLLDL